MRKNVFPLLLISMFVVFTFVVSSCTNNPFQGTPDASQEYTVKKVQPTLNPNSIPQFVEQLPLLSVQGGTIETIDKRVTTNQEDIIMSEFQANILPATTKLPNKAVYGGTWVWGYRKDISSNIKDTYIGPVFVTKRNKATQIRWVNNLPTTTSNLKFWWTSTDQTLHWADPLNGEANMGAHLAMPPAPGSTYASNYLGPVPAVVHLHGGEVPPVLDGGPDAWFTSSGSYKGHSYYTKSGASANEAIYNYRNTQEAASIWFHDHAIGITRLNVYAGMAGAYIITDDGTNAPNPLELNLAANIIPVVIQDRMFDPTGQLYFPNAGINPEHPYWIPEFVGDVIVVNGKSWPYLNVEPKSYRFLFLNGSNARAYELDLFDRAKGTAGPPMWVIGTDGGYLNNPVKIDPAAKQKLIIMPGERYDVIIDFNPGWYPGQVLELRNTAKTPYPGGAPVSGGTTGRIMRFNVWALGQSPTNLPKAPSIGYTPVAGDPLRTHIVEPLTQDSVTRQLTLNEVMGAGGPLEVVLNNTKWGGKRITGVSPDGKMYTMEPIPGMTQDGFGNYLSELPGEGTTELWEIINMTADAHPIHLHLVQFQLVGRQAFDLKGYTAAYAAAFQGGGYDPMTGLPYPVGIYIPGYGPPNDYGTPNADGAVGGNPGLKNGPVNYLLGLPLAILPQEMGWKDTVIMYPGQVTRILVRWAPTDATVSGKNYFPFDPNGGHGYVWHCHIIDHEDNEMMRPTSVTTVAVTSGKATTADPNGTVLTDANADFVTAGVVNGMTVKNDKDKSMGVITNVTSTTITATLTGGTNNAWAVDDSYNVGIPRNFIKGVDY